MLLSVAATPLALSISLFSKVLPQVLPGSNATRNTQLATKITMIRLKDIRLQPKLIGLMLLVSIVPIALVAWWGSRIAHDALLETSYHQLQSMREVKRAQIERFFAEREGDMGVLVETAGAMLSEAFHKLEAVQELKGENLKELFETIPNIERDPDHQIDFWGWGFRGPKELHVQWEV